MHIKNYTKRLALYVSEKNQDRIFEFKTGFTEFFKFVITNFDEF